MILELGPASVEFIRITAEYSNVVLLAVLPHVSNTVERLDLPVARPVTPDKIIHCSIKPVRKLGVQIAIRGGWYFTFEDGYVRTVQSPYSYYAVQDPDIVPKFFGTVRIPRVEAIQLARKTLTQLGIPLDSVFADQEPNVTSPERVGSNVVPRYFVKWPDPRGGPSAEIEINADSKRFERISLRNRSLERPEPNLAVAPVSDPRQPKWPKVSRIYAERLIPIVLRALDDYGKKLSLAVPRPITTNHIRRLSVTDNGGWPHCEVELTNGWRFVYRNSMVAGYETPDKFFATDQSPIRLSDFLGVWTIKEPQACNLVRETLAKLDYPTNLVHFEVEPQVTTPTVSNVPRYLFFWYFNDKEGNLESMISAEVDAEKCQVKSLYYDHKLFWNHPPPIDVPISTPNQANPDINRNTNRQLSETRQAPVRPFKLFKANPAQ